MAVYYVVPSVLFIVMLAILGLALARISDDLLDEDAYSVPTADPLNWSWDGEEFDKIWSNYSPAGQEGGANG